MHVSERLVFVSCIVYSLLLVSHLVTKSLLLLVPSYVLAMFPFLVLKREVPASTEMSTIFFICCFRPFFVLLKKNFLKKWKILILVFDITYKSLQIIFITFMFFNNNMWNTKKRKKAKLFVLKRSTIFVSHSFWWNIYFSFKFQKYD